MLHRTLFRITLFFFYVTKTLLMHELFVDISQAHPYELQIQTMRYSLLKKKLKKYILCNLK